MDDVAVSCDFSTIWVSDSGRRHSFLVAQIPVGVVHANCAFLVDQAFVGVVEVFPSLLCVLFDNGDGLINRFGEGVLVECERGSSIAQFFS